MERGKLDERISCCGDGSDMQEGTIEAPFSTIAKAARMAEAGDRVIVHEGVYREWVKPMNGGNSSVTNITYEAATGEKVVIKGSERIQNWILEGETVWKVVIPNEFFGDYNPYMEELKGDWLFKPENGPLHTGEVYLNGKAFYEVPTLDEVRQPVHHKKVDGVMPLFIEQDGLKQHPDDYIYRWYTQVDEQNTVIYANFQGLDPNEEMVEINVRQYCFYPERSGLNYITVRGFEMCQAACPWAPPTANQSGLIGVHFARGWIIENNIIHDAKCSAISIGRDDSLGNNLASRTHRKSGTQFHIDGIFKALGKGWNRESIGSHIIRNNVIYNCGQNAIVGHLGGIFSQIYNNHIYNIGVKHEFFGYEIAGIKLHSAIDVQIHHNHIHNCTMGIWLDWEAQGTRVSSNLFYDNDLDLMTEVNHGPYTVDNNIFASRNNLDNVSQGGAYLHNLFCGGRRLLPDLYRFTPYHVPHSTQVAGTAIIYGGDDRIFQNIYLGGEDKEQSEWKYGTEGYNGHAASMQEFLDAIIALGDGDAGMFRETKQPVYIRSNAYLKGAEGFKREECHYVSVADPEVQIKVEGDGAVWLEMNVERGMLEMNTQVYATEHLELPRIVEAPFENPDGTPIVFDTDYLNNVRDSRPIAGPFARMTEGYNRIRVW